MTASENREEVKGAGSPETHKTTRSIVLFADTLHLSTASLARAKQHLKRFVDEQISDQDEVAIITTSGELGLLSQFMHDRKMLKVAIDKITGFYREPTLFTPYLAARVLSQGSTPPPESAITISGQVLNRVIPWVVYLSS